MRPVQLGVRVDHLRLEPQAELHAPGPHVIHQAVQPARPDLLVHPPVAEPGVVVAAPGEPAVVQHVPLHPGLGRQVRQRGQPVQVVVEVDGLPHVQVDRPGRARVRGPRAQVAVELVGQLVQPGAGGQVDPRGGVGLAPGQADLAGQQQLAAADDGGPGRHPLDVVHGVAAPRHVQAVDLAVAEREPGRPGDHQGGRVVPGVAAASLAQPQAVGDPVPLRGPLGQVPPAEVEDLGGLGRQREDHVQGRDRVRQPPGVGQRVPGPDGAAGDGLDLGDQPQARGRVGGLDPRPRPALGMGHAHRPEQRRPVPPGDHGAARGIHPVPGKPRPAEPPGAVLGQQRAGPLPADRHGHRGRVEAVRHGARPHRGQRLRLRQHHQAGPGPVGAGHQEGREKLTRPIILLAPAKQQPGPSHVLRTWSLTTRAARRRCTGPILAGPIRAGPIRAGRTPGSARTRRPRWLRRCTPSHAVSLIRLAYLMLGDRAAAEDAVQDAFCGLYRHWDRLADPAGRWATCARRC